MPLKYRKRGDVWYCRGTLRWGRQTVTINEFSTGATRKSDAMAVGTSEEARVLKDLIETGTTRTQQTITIHDCIDAYKSRPGGLHPFDIQRLVKLDKDIGDQPVTEAKIAWSYWVRQNGSQMAPATVARWRSSLLAAVNYGGESFGIAVPSLPPVRAAYSDRIAYLTVSEEARLLASYNEWVAPVMLLLCETGMRTQEALRLDWRHVDWQHEVLIVEHSGRSQGSRTKSGRSRAVGMRSSVREMLHGLWVSQKRPDTGTVFLNKYGKPYSDTRVIGGSPLTTAHQTACRKAGINDFRVHDWRHHFAVWFLKRGGNLRALCQIAGWSSIRMVQRYAVFEQSDLNAIMQKTSGK